jgi:hypothetical protein
MSPVRESESPFMGEEYYLLFFTRDETQRLNEEISIIHKDPLTTNFKSLKFLGAGMEVSLRELLREAGGSLIVDTDSTI